MSRFPSPAPLPSLSTAFSRRAALFGAVVSTGALAGSAAKAYGPQLTLPTLAAEDARLIALAEIMADSASLGQRIEALSGDAYYDHQTWHWAVDAFCGAAAAMEKTPAATAHGLNAKARAMRQGWVKACPEISADLGASLAADILRLNGEAV